MSETVTFGGLLRQHRLAASLSQVMLAERARLSVSAVAALERGRRIAPRPATVAFLAEALGLGPVARAAFIRAAAGAQVSHTGGLPLPRNLTGVSATRRNLSAAQTQLLRVELATASPAEPRDPALIAARLRQSTPSPVLVGSDDDLTALERTLPKRVVRHAERAPAGRRHNLPAPHRSLIGREGNAATVRDLVTHARGRLVTLTGAGGCGKTQLALKVATDLVNAFEDGVWFVDLASLHVPDLVPCAVAAVLGPRGRSGQSVEDTLLDYLTDRNVLLVLDNCEHLIDVCASLADRVLSECPQVRLLATSREPLRIQREITWRVPSLALPDDRRTTSVDELAQSPSVQLFMERAKAVEPAFVLTARNAPTIGQICRRLDGLPLGIELAAARLRALGVDQILERL
jgi:transcriptional regulator with XRE-family HTH domain